MTLGEAGPDLELMSVYARGWALARGCPPPELVEDGFHIAVGKPDQKARYIFPALDPPRLSAFLGRIAEPGVVVKVCAPGEAVARVLAAPWTLQAAPNFIMAKDLAPAAAGPTLGGYSLTFAEEGRRLVASIADRTGAAVARASGALASDLAVIDHVSTDEPHRRRGLGRALVTTLEAKALRRGARRVMLSASVMGRALYEALGWRLISDYSTLFVP
jgi:GNAT superfamily N-acetyltransferase